MLTKEICCGASDSNCYSVTGILTVHNHNRVAELTTIEQSNSKQKHTYLSGVYTGTVVLGEYH